MNNGFDIIIPVVAEDVDILNRFFKYLKGYLPMAQLVLIGNEELKIKLQEIHNENMQYIEEDSLVKYSDIKDVIGRISGEGASSLARTGWYLQQFLKMQYAYVCDKEYYLVWDSDTVPLKEVKLMDDGHPVFHLKGEKHKPYFDTLDRLLPDVGKRIEQSFICEHMLINCKVMKELIGEIEHNQHLPGIHFYEKILYAIDLKELDKSGFSEFETYGNFCITRHPDLYKTEKWSSLRGGNKYFDNRTFGEHEMKWLVKKYDAVSFEKTVKKMYGYSVFHNTVVQRVFSFGFIRIIMNIYHVFARGLRRCIRIARNKRFCRRRI